MIAFNESNIILVKQNLLTVPVEVIVQQCNCVTVKASGLAENIANAYPYANIYLTRPAKSAPGTVELCRPSATESGPVVACLMAQICPGKPGAWSKKYRVNPELDMATARERLFEQCLDQLSTLCAENNWTTIAFPYGIGCGLAGGSWAKYERMIYLFSKRLSHMQVLICQL